MELKGELCRLARFSQPICLTVRFHWTKDIVIAGGGRHRRLLSGNLSRAAWKGAARLKLPVVRHRPVCTVYLFSAALFQISGMQKADQTESVSFLGRSKTPTSSHLFFEV